MAAALDEFGDDEAVVEDNGSSDVTSVDWATASTGEVNVAVDVAGWLGAVAVADGLSEVQDWAGFAAVLPNNQVIKTIISNKGVSVCFSAHRLPNVISPRHR